MQPNQKQALIREKVMLFPSKNKTPSAKFYKQNRTMVSLIVPPHGGYQEVLHSMLLY